MNTELDKTDFKNFMREQVKYFEQKVEDVSKLTPEQISKLSCSFRESYEANKNTIDNSAETDTSK